MDQGNRTSGGPGGPADRDRPAGTEAEPQIVVAIDPVTVDEAALPRDARVVKIPFRALTTPFLSETRPACVMAPLLAPDLDALQVAERLGELQFKGTLLLVGPTLPNPKLVAREIKAATKSKDIKVEFVTERRH